MICSQEIYGNLTSAIFGIYVSAQNGHRQARFQHFSENKNENLYHSVLGLVLTFNIFTIRETLFFRCGIITRIILNAYFPPLLSLPFT